MMTPATPEISNKRLHPDPHCAFWYGDFDTCTCEQRLLRASLATLAQENETLRYALSEIAKGPLSGAQLTASWTLNDLEKK